MAKLGINVDHIATVRQARGTKYPDPLAAALMAERGGADQITVHLREDRRHIQEEDVRVMRRSLQTELNLEMAATEAMVKFAIDLQPNQVTLVPEKRQEVTTEGGLDCLKNRKSLAKFVPLLRQKGVRVSLFIDPEPKQIEAAKELRSDAIEIHTGCYADARLPREQQVELERIRQAAILGKKLELWVACGHGLNYQNTTPVAQIPEIVEFNIGHSIIARALFVGIESAVREMKKLVS